MPTIWLQPRLWLEECRSSASLGCFLSAIFALTVAGDTLVDAEDWTFWRGPHQNGVAASVTDAGSRDAILIERFDPRGGEESGVRWKSEAAAGISTPIAMNGRLYTIVRHQPSTPTEGEQVICLDAASGEVLWQHTTNVFLSDVPAERVGWSNVTGDVETDSVYSLSACSLLQCLDATTGQPRWAHSMSEEFGMLSTYGGRTNTPVIFEDLVIISGVTTGWDLTARPAHRFFAFDKRSGVLVWTSSTNPLPEDTTYSTPVFGVVDGRAIMIAGSGDGRVNGFHPRTGERLWNVAISRRGINTTAVIDSNGFAFIGHGEENPEGTAMGAVVCVDISAANSGSQSAEVWRTEELIVGKSSPLLIKDESLGDRLYVVEDSSRLHVLDARTGVEIGEPLKLGTAMRGSLVYADGKIYAATSTGLFYVLRPVADGVETVFKTRLPKGHDVGGSPIVADGCLYLPTTSGLFCLSDSEDRSGESVARPISKASQFGDLETPSAEDTVIASLQIIPAEAILSNDQSIALEVRGFNSLGQRVSIENKPLVWEVTGSATVSDSNELQVRTDEIAESVSLTVRLGDVIGSSRYRVVAPLPWKFDFSNQVVPVTWIGARYRHEARSVNGDPAIVKITTIPKGTRSQTWMGSPDLSGYTITVDVQAQDTGEKLPDMGLINQRYTLDLMGEAQQLQIRTWTAQLRMARSVPYAWQAGRWYRLKFTASLENNQAILKGKVWPRDEGEPSQWTLTATDDSPNSQGSPGLFGNATNAEIMIDNVSVVPNE
ncbi:outer membrane protein assembly factor BamB family protein [Neorhodopirellula pilleata]|uniref:Outer membrane biogenesis protein BamB n=1 Tax=Neorhodopirellula pilleata TaxID=2714738 RepID=A0A5C6A480_9BACT|nr:PQQ-binding-like beta-propeller repeat protein [Neorhodopirellula pilleata]TWT94309.1 outer membrane biogenesis protein BamB [Neorhodopirellula pilleata]